MSTVPTLSFSFFKKWGSVISAYQQRRIKIESPGRGDLVCELLFRDQNVAKIEKGKPVKRRPHKATDLNPNFYGHDCLADEVILNNVFEQSCPKTLFF